MAFARCGAVALPRPLARSKPRSRAQALEQALQTFDNQGEKQCLSYRCADLNKLLPDMMGVSPAVLESVIFVHQARPTRNHEVSLLAVTRVLAATTCSTPVVTRRATACVAGGLVLAAERRPDAQEEVSTPL